MSCSVCCLACIIMDDAGSMGPTPLFCTSPDGVWFLWHVCNWRRWRSPHHPSNPSNPSSPRVSDNAIAPTYLLFDDVVCCSFCDRIMGQVWWSVSNEIWLLCVQCMLEGKINKCKFPGPVAAILNVSPSPIGVPRGDPRMDPIFDVFLCVIV